MQKTSTSWMTYLVVLVAAIILGFVFEMVAPTLGIAAASTTFLGIPVTFAAAAIIALFVGFVITLVMHMGTPMGTQETLHTVLTILLGVVILVFSPIVLGVHAILAWLTTGFTVFASYLIGSGFGKATIAGAGSAAPTMTAGMYGNKKPRRRRRRR